MMYHLYQAQADLLLPLRGAARGTAGIARLFANGEVEGFAVRHAAAALDLFASLATTHARPPFGFARIAMGNRMVDIEEEQVAATPFCTLLRFRKDIAAAQPKVLVVAPMSGHFATLLRGTVETMLPDFDVHITDWHNARDIPLAEGVFGFDDFVSHVMRFLRVLGPGSHVLAVCQPSVAVLAGAALMAEERDRAQPRSMTLMAGPIDTRISPTRVNELAIQHPIAWFERHMIATVPWRLAGGGRRVYPGATQLAAFMSMNLDRHIRAHIDQLRNLARGDHAAAEAHRRFYEEYFAVMDLPAEFYLQTVQRVFQDHDLPRGRMTWRGRPVRPDAIRRTALMTVEGEKDDICAIGQTMAALDLCPGIPITMRQHHLQTGVGHYGVFNGKRWQGEIYPRVRQMIQAYS